jgi:hypothetical protein
VRNIDEVLHFRNDLSPFLVHLTRDYDEQSAEENLVSILASKKLKYGHEPMSVARYRYPFGSINPVVMNLYFKAVSFTETPLKEVQSLLNIEHRAVNFSPYGLVFLKDKCMEKGASPVIYINNMRGDKNDLVESLCRLAKSNPMAAHKILPYVSLFGKKLRPYKKNPKAGEMDFTWEREWRFASLKRYFGFDESDVFIGLCPHNRIEQFEDEFDWLPFIDARRNLEQYAEKIEAAKMDAGIAHALL